MAKYTRNWAKKYFDLFTSEDYASVTLTTVNNTRHIKFAIKRKFNHFLTKTILYSNISRKKRRMGCMI